MPGPMPPMEFSMPMYRDWVPEAVRPWIYVFFAIVFQLSGGIYLGSLSQMMGTTSFMREDIMMIGMCAVVGVAMPFPFLFRFKFRYTNRQLLLNAMLVIAVCNFLCMKIHSIPLLCVISFIAGFLKLCGTFECMSNIQLWMAPGRDFTLFFPKLYIVIIGGMQVSPWIATQLTYHFGSWQMMHWFMIALLLVAAVILCLLTRNVRLMPKIPMISMDWLGCALWSLVLLEGIWIFTYGEYYNWWDGQVFRIVCYAFVLTLMICIGRMMHIRHPYIEPKAFQHRGFIPVLILFAVNEYISATPKALQNVFTSAVLGYGTITSARFYIFEFAGTILGCLFSMWWIRKLNKRYTKLLSLGFATMLLYQLIMYFTISPDMNIEMFYVPTMLRTFGYAIFFTALTIYAEEIMTFQHFFMALTICGFIRNGLVSSMATAGYSFALRAYEASYLTHSNALAQVADSALAAKLNALAPLMSGVKVLFGWTCIIGCAILLIFLLFDTDPGRKAFKKMPSWESVGYGVRRMLFMK